MRRAELARFARAHGIAVDQNYDNMPNRVLRWRRDGIDRIIQIDLYGERLIQFAYHAYHDKGGSRHGTRWPPIADVPLADFKSRLHELLEHARTILDAVSIDDLEYWTWVSTLNDNQEEQEEE